MILKIEIEYNTKTRGSVLSQPDWVICPCSLSSNKRFHDKILTTFLSGMMERPASRKLPVAPTITIICSPCFDCIGWFYIHCLGRQVSRGGKVEKELKDAMWEGFSHQLKLGQFDTKMILKDSIPNFAPQPCYLVNTQSFSSRYIARVRFWNLYRKNSDLLASPQACCLCFRKLGMTRKDVRKIPVIRHRSRLCSFSAKQLLGS